MSQALLQTPSPADSQLQDDCDAYILLVMTIGSLPAMEPKLGQIKEALKADDVCQQVILFVTVQAKTSLVHTSNFV